MAVSEGFVGWGVLLAVSSVTAAVIVNGVAGNYQDSKSQSYGAVSNKSSVSAASVSAAMVQPKVTAPNPSADAATHGTAVTKTFTITNDSNITDAYVITQVSATAGSVQSVVFAPTGGATIPASIGSTVSPQVPPGGTMTVYVTLSTGGATIGSNIEVTLTAKTTAQSNNGPQMDVGKQWIYVARGPQITGLAPLVNGVPAPAPSAGFPVDELVNGRNSTQAEPGTALTFSVPFTNTGDAPALGLTVTAQIPPQLAAVAGSVKLQAADHRTGKSVTLSTDARASVSGTTVTASVPELAPGTDVTLTYGAATTAAVPIGTVVANSATIGAQSMTSVVSTPAIVLVGAMNVVFDALGGAAQPVSGAQVTLLDAGQKAKLAAAGSVPNPTDTNPFPTASGGAFGFTLAPTAPAQTSYELDTAATGYLNRRIKVGVETGKDGLPTVTLSAIDGLPLAGAGGFTLGPGPITVAGVTGFFGNVPMFSPQMLALALSADHTVAAAGDRLGLRVDFGPGGKPIDAPANVTLELPASISYATGSSRLGGVSVEPTVSGKTLAWPLKDLSVRRTLTFDAVMLPGTATGATLVTRAHLAVNLGGSPLGVDANVAITVTGGAMSSRSILTGRVFTDHAHDGHFAAGDRGVPNVRIFLEDGESVLTDRDGRFSFPAARPGMHVLHLDPITLPAGVAVYKGFPVNDARSGEQLVHGISDSGLMSDVNFAVNDSGAH